MNKSENFLLQEPVNATEFKRASGQDLSMEECRTLMLMATDTNIKLADIRFNALKALFENEQLSERRLLKKLKNANGINSTFALGFALGRLIESERFSQKLRNVSFRLEKHLEADAQDFFFSEKNQSKSTIH